MSKLLSYDLAYVRGEVCLMKWSIEDGPMPAITGRLDLNCGRPAAAGIGLTRDGKMVHPQDPRAVGDIFVCDRHARGLDGLDAQAQLVPKIGTGGSN
jgi:hypothetical protein